MVKKPIDPGIVARVSGTKELKEGDHSIPAVKSGQKITETVLLDESVASEPTIEISQEPFYLCEADFLRIKTRGTPTREWAIRIFIASLGMTFIPIAKFFQIWLLGSSVVVQTWEWVAPCIGSALSIILLIIGKFLPNERKQVMRDIDRHFSAAPRRRHLGEKQK